MSAAVVVVTVNIIPFWAIPLRNSKLASVARTSFSRKHAQLRDLLVAARRTSKVTQAELAKRLGRSQSFVSKFERGERRIDVVEFLEIARMLGADAAAILEKLGKPSSGNGS